MTEFKKFDRGQDFCDWLIQCFGVNHKKQQIKVFITTERERLNLLTIENDRVIIDDICEVYSDRSDKGHEDEMWGIYGKDKFKAFKDICLDCANSEPPIPIEIMTSPQVRKIDAVKLRHQKVHRLKCYSNLGTLEESKEESELKRTSRLSLISENLWGASARF